jgi:pyruvate dehydrogenase E2 component (dihydrolipoamide acetyltransferase)
MATEIVLPRVDMDMEQGKLTHWFVKEGERVAKGQPLFEIETDKAAMEVEAPVAGVLRGVTAAAGDTLPVGTVIGWLYGADEPAPAPAAAVSDRGEAPPTASAAVVDRGLTGRVAAPAAVSDRGYIPRATPKARRLAREAGIDLRRVTGSGPDGRVQAGDILAITAGTLHREWLARGDRPPLVLIHGFGADLNGWRRWISYLPPGRGAMALDLPGHGRSALAGPVDIESFASAIGATLAAEGVRFAHLVAHSLGAAAAVALAAREPALVGSLTLIAPAGLGPEINGAYVEGFLAARSAGGMAAWLAELAVDPASLGSGLAETTLRQRHDLGVGESQARVAAALLPDGAQAFSVRAALAAYPGPVKVVFGLEDRIIPSRHSRGLPGTVAVHLLPNIGHMPHLEARALVAGLARDNAAAGDDRRQGA